MNKKFENKRPERMTERLDRLGLLVDTQKRSRPAFYDWLADNGYAEQQAANRPRQAAIDADWATLISSGTTYAWSCNLIADLHGENPFTDDLSQYEGTYYTVSQLSSEGKMSDVRERGYWIELLRENNLLSDEGNKPTQDALDQLQAVPRDFFIAEWNDEGLTAAVEKFLETHVPPKGDYRSNDRYGGDRGGNRGGDRRGGHGGGYGGGHGGGGHNRRY